MLPSPDSRGPQTNERSPWANSVGIRYEAGTGMRGRVVIIPIGKAVEAGEEKERKRGRERERERGRKKEKNKRQK